VGDWVTRLQAAVRGVLPSLPPEQAQALQAILDEDPDTTTTC
jgi:hypothetical protein